MTALRGVPGPAGGDPEEDEDVPRSRRVRGALERLAEELEETSDTLDRTIDELGDAPADGDGR